MSAVAAPRRCHIGTVSPMNAWATAGAVLGGLLLLWLALVLTLWFIARREGQGANLRDMLRLVPDLVRLLHGLARDPKVPRGVRIQLGALLVYLAIPIDLVPDFIPIVGYADDIVLVALVLRSVARRAGPEAIDRHWPGTPEGLTAIRRLTGYGSQTP
jgi:uncharacterized membrane protein YkvA (DUF1232 family)